jgi:hypothetical protein
MTIFWLKNAYDGQLGIKTLFLCSPYYRDVEINHNTGILYPTDKGNNYKIFIFLIKFVNLKVNPILKRFSNVCKGRILKKSQNNLYIFYKK